MDDAPKGLALDDESEGAALVDATAAKIRARIMSGDIPIGAQLRQAELASALGVSRTPVREALRQLQAGGLIDVVPNRGAVVRVPAPWEVREAYEVRAELEGLACERATRRISADDLGQLRRDNATLRRVNRQRRTPTEAISPATTANDDFHTLILRAAGNSRLARMVRDVNEAFPRNVSALVLLDDARHRDDNLAEHEQVVEALADHDAPRARAVMQAHVLSAGEQLARWYEKRSATVFRG